MRDVAIPGQLADVPEFAPLDHAEASQMVGEQESDGDDQSQASNDQVADSQEQVFAAHPGVGADHEGLRSKEQDGQLSIGCKTGGQKGVRNAGLTCLCLQGISHLPPWSLQ